VEFWERDRLRSASPNLKWHQSKRVGSYPINLDWAAWRTRDKRLMRLKFKAKRSIGREISHRIDLNGKAEAVVQRNLERLRSTRTRAKEDRADKEMKRAWYVSPSEAPTCSWTPWVRCARGLGISWT
jgi:hypothetical protein